MLIALIIALIFGTGGAESEFASYIPHIKKEIRQNVPEGPRRDTLQMLVKEYDRGVKAYEKETKKMKKQVNKASTNREVDTEELLHKYDDFYHTRILLISDLIGYRLRFQQHLTDDEMLMITDRAIFISKKDFRKEKKSDEKQEKQLEDVFGNINGIILEHIDDSASIALVSQSLIEFENTIYGFVDEARNLVEERRLRLDDRGITREQIEEMYEPTNKLRYKASRDFARLRENLINHTDKKQWRAINKELKVFLKS